MDYFKEKLAAKSNARVFGSSSSSTPAPPLEEAPDDYDERSRFGLGASRLRTELVSETVTETVEVEERRGLGGIGSGMRSSFASMFTAATVTRDAQADAELPVPDDEQAVSQDSAERAKSGKKSKKDKKTKKDKGKEKEKAADVEELEADVAQVEVTPDDKAERKRRKEEKRRRKEAQAAGAVEDVAVEDAEAKEKKRKKDKKKAKSES